MLLHETDTIKVTMNNSDEVFIENKATKVNIRMAATRKGVAVSTVGLVVKPTFYGASTGLEFIKES